MPEGDTILRIANTLGPRLTGKVLERVTTQGLPRDVTGRRVTGVTAHGKHLVIELDDGAHIRAHLGMNGRFRAYDRVIGDARLARMSPGRVSLALVTDDGVYLWIGAPTIDVSHRRKPLHGMAVAALGPDVLADGFDPRVAAGRASAHGARQIADVLLDQRVAAGIGNIWKTESLFAVGIHPRTRVDQIDAATLEAIYAAARRMMLAHTAPPTLGRSPLLPPQNAAPYQVYSRTGKPCPRCSTPIVCESLGEPPRWTWSCPRCQPI
jgi:endonuclease VIII